MDESWYQTRHQQLTQAIFNDNVDVVKRLLGGKRKLFVKDVAVFTKTFKSHINIDTSPKHTQKTSIFELSAKYCRHEILTYMLQLGVDVNHIHPGRLTALHLCLRYTGDDEMRNQCLHLLLSLPVDINCTRSHYAPLHIAAQMSDIKPLKMLLADNRINVNIVTAHGMKTPLMDAIYARNAQNIRHLIQHPNINVNARNNKGDVALVCACRYVLNLPSMCVRQILNHHNVDMSSMNRNGRTAMSYVSNGIIHKEQHIAALLTHGYV
jgi:ankyrin repeat protein